MEPRKRFPRAAFSFLLEVSQVLGTHPSLLSVWNMDVIVSGGKDICLYLQREGRDGTGQFSKEETNSKPV